ncbi:HAMP domain-containing protein [Methylobacterium sp. SD274]|uniref:methyl-accepting chemotaxis protein n=1 Tax=Methylobacterium sp. SD274 TaxID=2782009 RepID=UPI001A9632A1|nr:methyl-accepting chemotaxis protein [Methylobacterium sp. SD274]MBO1021671.1 HAMP domain-containing protein [Methylobacterium sp. SD274]
MATLSFKAAIAGSVSLAAIFTVGTIFLTRQIGDSFATQAEALQGETLSNEARAVRGRLDEVAQIAKNIAVVAGAMQSSGVKDRAIYDAALKRLLAENPAILATWTGWEANALDARDTEFAGGSTSDATGRFLPYWNRGSGTIVREVLTGYENPVEGAYYQQPKLLNRPVAIEPYNYPVAGKDTMIMSFGAPITVDGKFLGVGGIDIDLTAMSTAVASVQPFGTGYVTLVSAQGGAVAYPDAKVVGKSLDKLDPAAAMAARRAVETGERVQEVVTGPDSRSWRYMAEPIQAGATKDRWAIVTAVPVATLTAAADRAQWILIGISALCVLASSAILFALIRRLVGVPIRALGTTIGDMAAGDYNAPVPQADRRDEVGLVGKAVVGLRDSLRQSAEAEERRKEAARVMADEERRAGTRGLADGFENAVGGIVGLVASAATELQATAREMADTAARTAGQSDTVANAARDAAANVTAVATAVEELGSSVQEIARQVSGSSQLAQEAVDEALQTFGFVEALSGAVAKIGDMVTMINAIAAQTNLLALNATIEAARAGDAGRGFAVVASEVKELANQTARVTQDIAGQIAVIQGSTDQAVTAIGTITNRIKEISTVATTIAVAVEQQGAATQEIVRNVSLAAVGTGEVTSNVTGVADAAVHTGAAADQVLVSASELSRQSEHLGSEVRQFLANVRAA